MDAVDEGIDGHVSEQHRDQQRLVLTRKKLRPSRQRASRFRFRRQPTATDVCVWNVWNVSLTRRVDAGCVTCPQEMHCSGMALDTSRGIHARGGYHHGCIDVLARCPTRQPPCEVSYPTTRLPTGGTRCDRCRSAVHVVGTTLGQSTRPCRTVPMPSVCIPVYFVSPTAGLLQNTNARLWQTQQWCS